MPEPLFLFILAALVFSAFIKGSLGMGFSTICLAILANVIELKTAISIVVVPSLISNLMVMLDAGNWKISIQRFWLMLLMTAPGMLLGLQLLRQTDNSASLLVLAVVLISYGIWGLRNHEFRIEDNYVKRLNPLIGLTTGAVNGATGSQIFPVMPYLLSLDLNKDVVVQTINLSFTLCSLIMLVGLFSINALDTQSMLTYSLGLAPVMFGVWLGNKLRRKLSDRRFRQSVMILIVVLGALLLFR